MELQPLLRLGLGGALLASTQILNLFSLYRGTEWLQKNAPTAFVVLENSAFHETLLISGFGMCAWGLYEVWKRKHDRSSVSPDGKGPAPVQEINGSVSGGLRQSGGAYHETKIYHAAPDVDKVAEEVRKRLEGIHTGPSGPLLEAQLRDIQQIDGFIIKKDEHGLRETFDLTNILKFNIRMVRRSLKSALVSKAESEELDAFFKDGNSRVDARYGSLKREDQRLEFRGNPGQIFILNTSKTYREACSQLLALHSSSTLPTGIVAALKEFEKTIEDNTTLMLTSLNQSLSTNKRNIFENDVPESDRCGSAVNLY